MTETLRVHPAHFTTQEYISGGQAAQLRYIYSVFAVHGYDILAEQAFGRVKESDLWHIGHSKMMRTFLKNSNFGPETNLAQFMQASFCCFLYERKYYSEKDPGRLRIKREVLTRMEEVRQGLGTRIFGENARCYIKSVNDGYIYASRGEPTRKRTERRVRFVSQFLADVAENYPITSRQEVG